jgi:phosphopantetheinyl transferase
MTPVQPRIELWLVDLAKSAPALEDLERETPRLADEDRERAGAIRDGIARRERLATYSALRVLLERAVGAGIRRRPLVRDQGGAPRLAEGGAWFSLSHTEGFAMIGLAAVPPVGVDAERTRPLNIPPRRREEICAAAAGVAGAPLTDVEPDRAMVQAWVRLEAFTKARGLALFTTFADLGLRGAGRPRPSLAHIEAAAEQLAHRASLAVADVSLPCGLQGAIAAGPGSRLPHPRDFPIDRGSLAQLLHQPRPGPHHGPAARGSAPR